MKADSQSIILNCFFKDNFNNINQLKIISIIKY